MLCRPRLMKEQSDLQKLNDPTMIVQLNENDIYVWYVYLFGPDDTAYSNGIFKIKISIPPNYPVQAPTLHFQTRIFHPNVHFDTGEVCLEVLKDQWNPRWTIESIIRAVGVMLQNPNPDSPLNCDAANLLRANDKDGYIALAQYYTLKYAISKQEYQKKMNVSQKKNQ